MCHLGASRLRRAAVVLVALTLLAGSLALWQLTARFVEDRAQARFETRADEIEEALSDRMTSYEQVLRAGVALFAASDNVSRAEWRTFVGAMDLSTRYPGVQGVGFAARIPASALDAHEARVRAEGYPDYDVHPSDDRAEYTSIVLIEPFEGRNLRAFGYDMSSEPTRRAAMERARDTGEAALSGKVRLVQETDEDVQPGFLLYVPVYEGGATPASVEGRRAALVGYVYAPFRARDLMRGTLGSAGGEFAFEVHDGASVGADSLLFETPSSAGPHDALERVSAIEIAGHPWTLRFASPPAYDAPLLRYVAAIVLVAGLSTTVAVTGFLGSLVAARERREREQEEEIRRIEATSAFKTLVFTSLSHELKTPLTPITLELHLLRAVAKKSLDERGMRALDIVDRSFERLVGLVDDMLDVGRIESRQLKVHPKPMDLAASAREAVEAYRGVAERAGIEVTFAAPPGGVPLLADEGRIAQVLSNLVSNAVKFTPRGGRVRVEAKPAEGAAVVTVEDSGVGLSREEIARLFQPFSRPHEARSAASGTGLGLFVSKGIAESHGGSLACASGGAGKGATFTLTLPRRGGQAATARGEDDPRR